MKNKKVLVANEKKTLEERVESMLAGIESSGLEASVPEKIVDIESLTRESWLTYRRKGFGGSDAGTILGVNSWNDIQNLFLDKTGKLKSTPVDFKNQARLDAGHQMEPVIANIFAGFTGYEVHKDSWMYKHSAYPWMLADCDFVAFDDQGMKVGVECKYINPDDLKYKWSSGVYGKEAKIGNMSYFVQCCHYMCVMNLDRWFLCVWAGNNADDICIIRIDRDYEFERTLVEAEDAAWKKIQKGEAPMISAKTNMAMQRYTDSFKQEPVKYTAGYQTITAEQSFIDDLVIPYADLKRKRDDLKDQLAKLDDKKNLYETKFMEFLTSNGYEKEAVKYDEDSYITLEWGSRNSRSFDYKGLKAADPDTYAYLKANGFLKENTSKSLKVALKDANKIKLE